MENYLNQTLEQLCMQSGVSEYEEESGITSKIVSLVKNLNAEANIDKEGNVVCVVGKGEKTIILEAHMDEVGFIVEKMNGVVTVSARGIVKEEKIVDSNAYILGKEINGVIQSNEEDGVFTFIQGDSTQKELIQKGDIVALQRSYMQDGDIIKASALDNRLGCAVLLTVLRQAMENKWEGSKLVFVFSTKEEVGESSFEEVIKKYGGDFAIVVDAAYALPVDFDTTVPGVAIPTIGNGCAIQTKGKGFLIAEETVALAEKLAQEKGIQTQKESAPEGLGKTNFAQLVVEGVREGIVINVPAKNQHSEITEASISDTQEAVKLITAIIEDKLKYKA